jgi:hypothetical protein
MMARSKLAQMRGGLRRAKSYILRSKGSAIRQLPRISRGRAVLAAMGGDIPVRPQIDTPSQERHQGVDGADSDP